MPTPSAGMLQRSMLPSFEVGSEPQFARGRHPCKKGSLPGSPEAKLAASPRRPLNSARQLKCEDAHSDREHARLSREHPGKAGAGDAALDPLLPHVRSIDEDFNYLLFSNTLSLGNRAATLLAVEGALEETSSVKASSGLSPLRGKYGERPPGGSRRLSPNALPAKAGGASPSPEKGSGGCAWGSTPDAHGYQTLHDSEDFAA